MIDSDADLFFDLEQRILNSWTIIDDLKSLHNNWDEIQNKKELLKAITDLYEHKFDYLFRQYEKSFKAYCKMRNPKEFDME